MPTTPFSDLLPGQMPDARTLNRIMDLLENYGRIRGTDQNFGIGIDFTTGSIGVTDNIPREITIKITSGTNPYAWTQVLETTSGASVTAADSLSGTTSNMPAYEDNGNTTVAANTVVRAWLALGSKGTPEWRFVLPAATDVDSSSLPQTTTTSSYVQPACGATVSIPTAVSMTSVGKVGDPFFIAPPGGSGNTGGTYTYQGGTNFQNNCGASNSAPGTTIPSGSTVTGIPGTPGASQWLAFEINFNNSILAAAGGTTATVSLFTLAQYGSVTKQCVFAKTGFTGPGLTNLNVNVGDATLNSWINNSGGAGYTTASTTPAAVSDVSATFAQLRSVTGTTAINAYFSSGGCNLNALTAGKLWIWMLTGMGNIPLVIS